MDGREYHFPNTKPVVSELHVTIDDSRYSRTGGVNLFFPETLGPGSLDSAHACDWLRRGPSEEPKPAPATEQAWQNWDVCCFLCSTMLRCTLVAYICSSFAILLCLVCAWVAVFPRFLLCMIIVAPNGRPRPPTYRAACALRHQPSTCLEQHACI